MAQIAQVDFIIDNGDAGTSSTGTWNVSGGSDPYGSNSLFARPSATYTWQFTGQPAGDYEVLMWWTTYASRGTNISSERLRMGHWDPLVKGRQHL